MNFIRSFPKKNTSWYSKQYIQSKIKNHNKKKTILLSQKTTKPETHECLCINTETCEIFYF